ncbi:DoxX family protein [Humitalea rosea]
MMLVPKEVWKPRREPGIKAVMAAIIAAMEMTMFDTKKTAPYAALLLRVSLGLMFLAHGGLLKLATFGVAGTMGYFGSLGYPPIFGAIVIVAEIAAGLALIAGVWVSAVSLLTLPILIGAALQHTGNGWVFSAAGGGWEYPVFWIATMLVQAGLGAGAYALDLGRLLGSSRTPARA